MEEYTPANSINEESFRDRRRSRLQVWADGEGKVVLRVSNATLHLGLCFVLLVIMVEFMVRYQGRRRRCVGCFVQENKKKKKTQGPY